MLSRGGSPIEMKDGSKVCTQLRLKGLQTSFNFQMALVSFEALFDSSGPAATVAWIDFFAVGVVYNEETWGNIEVILK